ncbi:MAG: low specificity L-threonine aldolase [Bradyrhizobiaceae bacterium]|nr:low specificity L-threonine aldolase [Bradyrhizobiaceae bacterium]
MNFASDNAAPIAPEILEVIVRANEGFALAYGNDDWTRTLERRMSALFERDVAAFLVATGTAANAIAVAHCCQPWNSVLCHAQAHLATDEAGAPEFYGGGLKLVELPGDDAKIAPETLRAALGRGRGVPHSVIPGALSLSQSTEVGTVYHSDEVRALAEIAHARGLAVHMDGARLANAVASLGCTPAEITWKAGVDVLSFGATKNGAMEAEAVVFFDPQRAEGMASRRKRAGQLISKQRFAAAQFEAYLRDGLWLRLARRANAAAARLAEKLGSIGLKPVWPVEANEVFVVLPHETDQRLRQAGATYATWPREFLPPGTSGSQNDELIRLVTSFATSDADIESFVRVARGT